MTTRAVRLKGRIPPGYQFSVGLVARSAWQVAAVILRFVGQRHVAVVRGHPRASNVAGIAFLERAEVVLVLPISIDTVVTG